MTSGVSQAIHLIQQENNHLKDRIEALEAENAHLQAYVLAIAGLQKAILTIADQDNLMRLLDEILYQALVLTNTEHGSILLVDEETEELVFVLVHGDLRESLEGFRFPQTEGIAGAALDSREPQIVNQVRRDPRFFKNVDKTFGITSDQLLAIPMVFNKKAIGVIELVNKQDGTDFADSDVSLVSLLAMFSAVSLEQMAQEVALEEA